MCGAGGKVKWPHPCRKQDGVPQNLKLKLPYNPAMPLPVIDAKELEAESQRYVHLPSLW